MLTYAVTLVLALAPGALLGFVLPAGRDRWIVWAAAPILTLGLLALAMAWLPTLGLPNSAASVLVAEFVLAGLAVAATQFRQHRRPAVASADVAAAKTGAAPAATPTRGPAWVGRLGIGTRFPPLVDLVAVAVPALVTIGFGRKLLGPLALPPGWDVMNHAQLTRNILETGKAAVSSACTTGTTLPKLSCHFYPLATDAFWAQTAEVSGGHISTAIKAWSVLIGPLALVLAVYAVVRVFGAHPVVAGSAAAASAFLGPIWVALLPGRPPEAFGPGLSVSVALLTICAVRRRFPVRFGVLAGLGAAGLAMTHTYEILFVAVLAVALLFATPRRPHLRTTAVALGALVVSTLVSLAPFGSGLLGASSERFSLKPVFIGQVGRAWHYWIFDIQRYVLLGYPAPSDTHVLPHSPAVAAALALTVPCLLASPLCFVFARLRWARPWVLTWVVWMAIAIWTTTSGSAASLFVSGLWYGVRERMRVMILPLNGVLAVAGACALGLSIHWVVAKLVRRARDQRWAGAFAAVAAFGLSVMLVVLSTGPGPRTQLIADLHQRSPAGGAYPRVFRWLAQHTPKSDVVAYNLNLEYMTWSYANYGVGLLLGIPPVAKESKGDYDQRMEAWNWLVNNAGATPAGCLVDKYRVRYVAVGRQRVPRNVAIYRRARLAASPHVVLVHSDGGLQVYEVNAAGRACRATRP